MIAIVPARGGSKGVPGKNIKSLCGKPLIYYSIIEALKSKYISEVIVSTDSVDIADISKCYGAKCPFLRPSELATDKAKAIDNYIYSINRLNDELNYSINEFIVLQPTSPLRTYLDINNAIELFKSKKADSVISVTEFCHPVEWAKKIDENGVISNYFENVLFQNLNRQEITKSYVPNGAIYIFNFEILISAYSYYTANSYAYLMSTINSVDIDTELDFEFAEFLMRKRND